MAMPSEAPANMPPVDVSCPILCEQLASLSVPMVVPSEVPVDMPPVEVPSHMPPVKVTCFVLNALAATFVMSNTTFELHHTPSGVPIVVPYKAPIDVLPYEVTCPKALSSAFETSKAARERERELHPTKPSCVPRAVPSEAPARSDISTSAPTEVPVEAPPSEQVLDHLIQHTVQTCESASNWGEFVSNCCHPERDLHRDVKHLPHPHHTCCTVYIAMKLTSVRCNHHGIRK
jgi:hypothetical protein